VPPDHVLLLDELTHELAVIAEEERLRGRKDRRRHEKSREKLRPPGRREGAAAPDEKRPVGEEERQQHGEGGHLRRKRQPGRGRREGVVPAPPLRHHPRRKPDRGGDEAREHHIHREQVGELNLQDREREEEGGEAAGAPREEAGAEQVDEEDGERVEGGREGAPDQERIAAREEALRAAHHEQREGTVGEEVRVMGVETLEKRHRLAPPRARLDLPDLAVDVAERVGDARLIGVEDVRPPPVEAVETERSAENEGGDERRAVPRHDRSLRRGAPGRYRPLRSSSRIRSTSRNIRAGSPTILTRLRGELYQVTGTSAMRRPALRAR